MTIEGRCGSYSQCSNFIITILTIFPVVPLYVTIPDLHQLDLFVPQRLLEGQFIRG